MVILFLHIFYRYNFESIPCILPLMQVPEILTTTFPLLLRHQAIDLLCTPAHLTFSSSLQMALLHHHQILSIKRFRSSPVQKILSDMSIVPYPPVSFFFYLTIMLNLFCHIDLKIFFFPAPHPLYFYLFLLKIIPYYETL